MTSEDIEQALNDAFKTVMPNFREGEGTAGYRPLQGEPDDHGRDGQIHKSLTANDIAAQAAPRKGAAQ